MDESLAQAVELRFFGGATMEEAAQLVDIPKRTLERRWTVARAWLAARLR